MLKEKRQLYTTLLFLGGSDKLPPRPILDCICYPYLQFLRATCASKNIHLFCRDVSMLFATFLLLKDTLN